MDPLDLFSDTQTHDVQPSSPVSREQELAKRKQELIAQKAALQNEVDLLELKMNQLINKEKEEFEEKKKEEDDMVLRLLLNAEADAGEVEGSSENLHQSGDDDDDDDEDNGAQDLRVYDALPSRKWEERLEYLNRFYPDTSISNPRSTISLDYINSEKVLLKNIEFDLRISKYIRFSITLKLNKYKNTYQVHSIESRKISNNKLNSLLLQISNHFTETRNINLFLLTLNNIYLHLKERQSLFSNLSNDDLLTGDLATWEYDGNMLSNSLRFKKLVFYYDILFEGEELKVVYATNHSRLNHLILMHIDTYGLEKGVRKFVTEAGAMVDEVVEIS